VFGLYKGLACMVSGFLVGRGGRGACSVIVTEKFRGFYGRRLCVWRSIVDLLERVSNRKLDRNLFGLNHISGDLRFGRLQLYGLQHSRK